MRQTYICTKVTFLLADYNTYATYSYVRYIPGSTVPTPQVIPIFYRANLFFTRENRLASEPTLSLVFGVGERWRPVFFLQGDFTPQITEFLRLWTEPKGARSSSGFFLKHSSDPSGDQESVLLQISLLPISKIPPHGNVGINKLVSFNQTVLQSVLRSN